MREMRGQYELRFDERKQECRNDGRRDDGEVLSERSGQEAHREEGDDCCEDREYNGNRNRANSAHRSVESRAAFLLVLVNALANHDRVVDYDA